MGRQVALDMAAEGTKVVASDIATEGILSLQKEIEAQGDTVWRGNVMASREQIDVLIKTTVETYGRIDILINNAGLLIPGTIEKPRMTLLTRLKLM